MQTTQRVILTMNAFERARAVRETRNAMGLANLADTIASSVRGTCKSVAAAMNLVYGRAS